VNLQDHQPASRPFVTPPTAPRLLHLMAQSCRAFRIVILLLLLQFGLPTALGDTFVQEVSITVTVPHEAQNIESSGWIHPRLGLLAIPLPILAPLLWRLWATFRRVRQDGQNKRSGNFKLTADLHVSFSNAVRSKQ
jgi:hypothetical protein